MNLLTWRVVLRRAPRTPEVLLPRAIVTAGSPFAGGGLPPEVAMLLPNVPGAAAVIAAACATPAGLEGSALGLFLADPFLNLAGELAGLKAAGIAIVANIPSIEQQDPEFAQQLEDVGLDFTREADCLARFRRDGFAVVAAVGGAAAARAVRPLEPLAVVVLPRVADYAAGFPSFRRRDTQARAVAEALAAGAWHGPLLGLATEDEAAHETLWPDVLDGVLCRPKPLADAPANP